MLQRCNNPNRNDYKDYGAKGIKVCPRWHHFDFFLADMGVAPEGCTLDRKSNILGYEPGNCKWSTDKEQQRHRTNNRILVLNGREQCMSAWAEELGITTQSLYMRLKRGKSNLKEKV